MRLKNVKKIVALSMMIASVVPTVAYASVPTGIESKVRYGTPEKFKTVEKVPAFAIENLEIKEEMNVESKTVGALKRNGICYVLKEENEWLYVESGDVRGFVLTNELFTNEKAEAMAKTYMGFKDYVSELTDVAPVAEKTSDENAAYYYTYTTTEQTIVEKKYAATTAYLLNVREGKGTDTRILATLPQHTLCYVLADADQEWVYIETGNVRGFVHTGYLDQSITDPSGYYSTPNIVINPMDNRAWYYTHTTVEEPVSSNQTMREEIVNYASQFIGNPYIWGGTDPVNGADCSGFVQTIYRQFGITIPRVAKDQAYAGKQIPVSEAQPGDLIFYMDSTGYIYHVVMYTGNNQTVEAMNSDMGITTGSVMSDACWAINLID